MNNKNKAKGAFMVEFALTFPMYIGVAFSAIFGSLMLHDEYVLQTTTQNLAREFAIDAASSVQTNAQTGIVYGNAVNSILKYRKTLDDKLYLYKTTNEKGKQCTISIECNARNVSGSGMGQTYNMYKLDSAYIVLKGRIVPKEDLIPQIVQPVCPNLLDTMRKTRVELNINASLISKMAFDSEGGSAEGILHSEEYTADYGDYDLSEGENNGDTSVDNTPNLNPINSLIQTEVLPDTSKLIGYSSSYREAKEAIEAKNFESLLYDLLNEEALNKILWDRLISGNDIPNLINDLYKLGLLQTNKIDFLYSIYTDSDAANNWKYYANEYLKNYFALGTNYTFEIKGMKLLTISQENKSKLAPDTPSLVSLFSLSDDVDLTMGNTLATYQYLIGQVTVKNTITGVTEVYNVVFKAGDEIHSIIMQDYVSGVQTGTNNGLQMSSVGAIETKIKLPDASGTYWKEANGRFWTDVGAVNEDQYEGLYKTVNNVYYELSGTAITNQPDVNSWGNVYFDQTNTNSPAYTMVTATFDGAKKNYYIPLDNAASGVAIDTSHWKDGYFIDCTNNNEGIYLKVNGQVDGVTADRYFKLANVAAGFSVSEGSNWVKQLDGTYYDTAGVKTGSYVQKDGIYYLVDTSLSPVAATSGGWSSLYRDITSDSANVYAKINNDLFKVNAMENVKGAATTWTNFKVDTKGVADGLYVQDSTAYLQVKDPNVGINKDIWLNSSTVAGTVYLDANNSGNTGTYAAVNGKVDGVQQNYYYKLKDATADISKDTPVATTLVNGADNIRVSSDGKKYAFIGNSYYELADDAKPLTASDGTWKSAVYDTRRPHAYDNRTYYRNTIKINGANVDYFSEVDPVGVLGARDTDGKLLNNNECWNLIYSKGKVVY